MILGKHYPHLTHQHSPVHEHLPLPESLPLLSSNLESFHVSHLHSLSLVEGRSHQCTVVRAGVCWVYTPAPAISCEASQDTAKSFPL